MIMENQIYKTIDFQVDFTYILMIADDQNLLQTECSINLQMYYLW
jgi:hypothetical protein